MSVVFDSVVARGLQGAESLEAASKARLIAEAQRDLTRLAQPLRDWGATVDACAVWDAVAYRGILRAARDWPADLVVVGAYERRPMLQAASPNTRLQLLRVCPCPLLWVKRSSFDGYPTILAAIDPARSEPEPFDRSVLGIAQALSRAFHSELRAVHAFPDPATLALASAVEVAPGVQFGTENVAELHRRVATEWAGRFGIDRDHIDVRPGAPASVILDVMTERDVRLVVMGFSQRGPLEQFILGSTAEAVAFDAPCDVLLVRGRRESATDAMNSGVSRGAEADNG